MKFFEFQNQVQVCRRVFELKANDELSNRDGSVLNGLQANPFSESENAFAL